MYGNEGRNGGNRYEGRSGGNRYEGGSGRELNGRARERGTFGGGARDGETFSGGATDEETSGGGAQDGTERENTELIYGRNPVTEALRSDMSINKIIVCRDDDNGRLKAIEALARQKKIIVQYRSRKEIDAAILRQIGEKNVNHQGALAYISAAEYAEPEDIIKKARALGEDPFVLVLDGIQDPHNLGAVIRTADAVGAHGVIIPKRRSCALTGAVAKTSAGALSHVPVARVSNLIQTLDYLKSEGIWVAGTDLTGETEFFNAKLDGPLALVIGSEGNGMAELTRKNCDFVLTIPMKGKVTSLNASVAAGVVMYEIFRQRCAKLSAESANNIISGE